MNDRIYVIAGNSHQFSEYRRRKCDEAAKQHKTLSYSNFINVNNPVQLRGVSDPHGVFIGTWVERDDLEDIFQLLLTATDKTSKSYSTICDQWVLWRKNRESKVIHHGYGFQPSMVMIKNRSGQDGWQIFDTNPIPPQGRCVGVFSLPDDFDWGKKP